MTSQRVAQNKIEGASYSFSILIEELDKSRILRHLFMRSSWHLSSGLIWWDCFIKMMCLCLCTSFRAASLILFRGAMLEKKDAFKEDQWERYFQNEQTICKSHVFLDIDGNLLIPAAMIPNIEVMWSPECLTCDSFLPRLLWLQHGCTRRLRPVWCLRIHPDQRCQVSLTPTCAEQFTSKAFPIIFCSSPQTERTPPPAGFVQHKKLKRTIQTFCLTVIYQYLSALLLYQDSYTRTAFWRGLANVYQACVFLLDWTIKKKRVNCK